MRTEYGELELPRGDDPVGWSLLVDFSSPGSAPTPHGQHKPVVGGVIDGWNVGVVRVLVDNVPVDVVAEVAGPRQVTVAHLQAAIRDPAYRDQLRAWLGC